MNNPRDQAAPSMQEGSRSVTDQILAAIAAIRFGSVEIVIHDSKVVQIERKEKVRFNTGQTRP